MPREDSHENTNVTPSDTPHTRILPSPRPMAMITDSTHTACTGPWLQNRFSNQFMGQIYLFFHKFVVIKTQY